MKKSILFILVLLSVLFMCLSPALAEDRPVIKVASNVNIPYYIYYDGKDIKGFEKDVYTESLNRAGYDVEVVDVDWTGVIPGLLSEKWDMACSNIYITKEREEQMDFTEPFLEAYDVAVAKPDSAIKSLDDFKGHTIGTATGTSEAAWTESLQEKYGPFKILGYDIHETEWMDLEIGRTDAVTIGILGTLDYPQYNIVAFSDKNSMIGCAVRTGSELKAKFDAALQEMKKDGTTKKLYEQYIKLPIPEGSAIVTPFEKLYVPE